MGPDPKLNPNPNRPTTWVLAHGGGGRGKCHTPCKKGGEMSRQGKCPGLGYVRGGNVQGECPDPR